SCRSCSSGRRPEHTVSIAGCCRRCTGGWDEGWGGRRGRWAPCSRSGLADGGLTGCPCGQPVRPSALRSRTTEIGREGPPTRASGRSTRQTRGWWIMERPLLTELSVSEKTPMGGAWLLLETIAATGLAMLTVVIVASSTAATATVFAAVSGLSAAV